MEENQKQIAKLIFQNKIYSSEGLTFQNLFVKIMSLTNPNFKAVKPWGNMGDEKNDGFDDVKGVYYQVFAPEDISKPKTISDAVNKIEKDFKGLFCKWNSICPIHEYYFVINDKYKGLPPSITQKVIELRQEPSYIHITIDTFTSSDLQQKFMQLKDEDIIDIVGFLPDQDLPINTFEYYEKLWKQHFEGEMKYLNNRTKVKELIDFFVVPCCRYLSPKEIEEPIFSSECTIFVNAGSGFGKTTLLHISVLCNIIYDLMQVHSSVISENSKNKFSNYERIRHRLFGDEAPYYFPVFINSERVNSNTCCDPLDLADAKEMCNFKKLVSNAHQSGKLLFLIDSFDEVKSDLIGSYVISVEKLLREFPNAKAILGSRFLERDIHVNHTLIWLEKFNEEQINKITHKVLSDKEADLIIERYRNDLYFKSIACNPFMLVIIMNIREKTSLEHLLDIITDQIIRQRWDKYHYPIEREDFKLLLGFLACTFIFGGFKYLEQMQIRECFSKAEEISKDSDAPFEAPIKDIDYFLNTLSNQSGIINIVKDNFKVKYTFQDTLIMCWLASNYIVKLFRGSEEIDERKGINCILQNANWLDRFIRSFSYQFVPLSLEGVNTLVMTLVKLSEKNGKDLQTSILYFLIYRDAISLDESETKNILSGYKAIRNDLFGTNAITNRENNDAVLLIKKMIKSHDGELVYGLEFKEDDNNV